MLRKLSACLLLSLVASASGCAICCSPFDEAYSGYGGRWQRDDMYHGRVGSAFAPAGGPVLMSDEDDGTLSQPESVERYDEGESPDVMDSVNEYELET